MATPLYKFLKENGYSTYVFPGSAEDISSAYQNDNYEMNFSKFMLLNIDLSKMDLDNLDGAQGSSQGFTNKLSSVWDCASDSQEFSNWTACERSMKKYEGLALGANMDCHDFTWYFGHGNTDRIS